LRFIPKSRFAEHAPLQTDLPVAVFRCMFTNYQHSDKGNAFYIRTERGGRKRDRK